MSEYFILQGGRYNMHDIKRGNIYFNTIKNLYYVVTGVNPISHGTYNIMYFDGYNTHHEFLGDGTLTIEESEKYYIYQVGGMY